MPAPRSTFRGSVEVQITGLTETIDNLEEIGLRAYATLPLMDLLHEPLRAAIGNYVAMEPWEPTAPSTQARKASQGENPNVLRDEARPVKGYPTRSPDKLWNALQHGGNRYYSTRTTSSVGIATGGSMFYADILEKGRKPGTRGGYMPKRRLVAIPEKDAVEIIALMAAWIVDPIVDSRPSRNGSGTFIAGTGEAVSIGE